MKNTTYEKIGRYYVGCLRGYAIGLAIGGVIMSFRKLQERKHEEEEFE
jgi:hypothetical protein